MEKFRFLTKNKISQLPKNPGVYVFKKGKEFLYIGKAANIRERVKNHSHPVKYREAVILPKAKLFNRVKQIGYLKTNSEIEALILEANLIKKYQPKYNVVWRDDKNYFYICITKEAFPRIFWTHQTKLKAKSYKLKAHYVGPFVDGTALKQTLKILRKVFPYRSCQVLPKKTCLWHHLERCPAPCLLKSNLAKEINLETKLKKECQKNSNNLIKILRGKRVQVLKDLKREMKKASASQGFERAAKIRDQIGVLERVISHAKIFEAQPPQRLEWFQVQKILQKILKIKTKISKIEAYDISNIQGQEATGSMVTFVAGQPDKNQYRKFKISGKFTPHRNEVSGAGPNDVAMIKETLSRRFKHQEWPLPDLILIDGGRAQLNVALNVINQHKSDKSALISVLALAKKENKLFIEGQKEPILLKNLPREIFNLILQLRDEAHRFARKYHHQLREIDLLKSI